MNFKQSIAQELYVVDHMSPASQLPADDQNLQVFELSPVDQFENELEVKEPVEIEIIVEELPGAPTGTKDPEPIVEVMEEPISAKEEEKDNNDAKKKSDKWNWEQHGAHGFVNWIKSRLDSVPKHSGYDSAGLERAVAYLEKLDNEISKAMRMDLDGDLDADKIEDVRSQLDDGLSRLQARLKKVKDSKKSKKKKAEYIVDEDGFVKEAQKIAGVQGTFVTVPLYISSIARTCINGMVSAGHDIEWIYKKQVEKYNLDERDKLALRQLLFDMGLPMFVDMGLLPEEDMDLSSTDNYNFNANYKG